MSLPRAFEKIIKLRNLDLAKLEPCAVLQAGQNFAVVVGTRHDCAVSAGRVRLAVETLGREMKGVAVELCTQRLPDLKGEKPLFTPEGIPYYSGTQKAVAAQKDFDKDMIQAIISSIRSSGVNMYLIDRYFAATKHRFYAELGRDEREMLQEGFDFETLLAISSTQQRLPDAVVARLPEEILSDGFRRAFGVIREERDEHLSRALHSVVGRGKLTVAVVGAGHLLGMCNHWIQDCKGKTVKAPSNSLLDFLDGGAKLALARSHG
eukprot:TRINITY_DN23167_c0_g1_i2.p1 TRINITY_DN23167_c0_g1~~TRINITY_DN23167_c0_g1_i2.p1  ORF type:complete len:264 (+),score=64.91 TRINITY_DN23167_c0_g1_i2:130-921(+)